MGITDVANAMAVLLKKGLLLILLTLIFRVNLFPINRDEYLQMRQNVLDKEHQMQLGAMTNISDAEHTVNVMLMKLKAKELENARRNVTIFPPAIHFFSAKPHIDESEVFKIIRIMPKGKLLLYTRSLWLFCKANFRA